jgi:hypothetical protein
MTAPVTQGTAVKLGFASFVYTGYIPEDGLTIKKDAGNIEQITNGDGETITKIIMDPGDQLSATFIILDSGGSVVAPIQGNGLLVTDTAGAQTTFMVESATVTFARGNTKLDLDLTKETSMTYSVS